MELGALLGLSPAEAAAAAAAAAAAQQPGGAQAAAGAARQRVGSKGLKSDGSMQQAGDAAGDAVVWLVWAEASGERMSPSLLMGYSLLTSRRDSALFLRMATGFGFAQVWPLVALCPTDAALVALMLLTIVWAAGCLRC